MRVFIAVDLEGASGVTHEWEVDVSAPGYRAARRSMQSDLEAALAGCFAAGADEIVVCDAHDTGGNIDAAFLPVSVVLAAGSPSPYSMMQGIGPDFDAALFVAYHAKAGTAAAVLEHTWTYKVFDASIGGVSLGEFGLGALLAGHFGVPAAYVSGDDKVAAEAQALVPGIVTTVVKHGITRTSAMFEPAEKARSEIRADVEEALRGDKPAPPAWSGDPLVLTFTRVPFCDFAAAHPAAKRLDGRTLEIGGADFEEVFRGFLGCLDLAANADV